MMWFGVLGIVFMIIPLAYVLASLVGLSYLWYRVLKVKRGSDLPTCAACGYAVRGLAGLTCPECGADLREVGITTQNQRGVVSPVLFVLLWTLLLPGPSCLVSGLLVAVGPKTNIPNHSLTLNPIHSGEYNYIQVDHSPAGSRYTGAVSTTSIMIGGITQQWEQLSDIDPVAMTYEDWWSATSPSPGQRVNPQTVNTTKPLDRQAVLDVMKRAGADITKMEVIDEADEVLTIIAAIPTQGLPNAQANLFTTTYMNTGYDQPAGWFIAVNLVVWIAVWIAGLIVFFRIRGKQLPQTSSGRRDPPRFAPPSTEPPAPSGFQ